MGELFTAEFFAGNRARLRELFTGTAPIVITANGQLQRSADTMYPFQQDTNFWYLTGINDPDVVLVMDSAKEYLILPERSSYQDTFDGHIDTASISRRSGIENIYDFKEGWRLLGSRLRRVKHVATIAPPSQYIDVYGMYTNPARWVLVRSIRQENETIELLDLREHLTRLRMVKQVAEITAIARAIAITVKGLKQVTRPSVLSKYAYEYEIEADLTRAFRREASNHAFEPIIAGGERACTLHNIGSTGVLSADELLLFDIGAEFEGYAADISRTIAIGAPSRRQQQIHEAVREVQEYAFSILKPGMILLDYEKQIEHFMGEKLRELGLIKTIETDAVREFYPHATSHHLGLDVHDVDDRTRPLEPNMVITVEPGIYIPNEGIGVRIEDDVCITENGIKILTSSLSSELE
jgi:Xaa-Pro aminopeptidase